jgi:hypothetical protein
VSTPSGWPWDPIVNAVTAPFEAAAGWTWDTVVRGVTDWLAKGFVQAVSFVWIAMDQTTSPHLDSEWFAHSAGAPYVTAVAVASSLLLIFVFCGLIQGVLAGRPLELVKRMALDTPAAIGGILFTVAFTQVGIALVDAMTNDVWSMTRARAVNAVDGLILTGDKLSPGTFLSPLLLTVGSLALLMLWVVLGVRDALIYLVVALAPLAWATSVWPAIAPVRRRVLELLAGLVFSKLVIALALAVGLGAIGGVGATGSPGDGTVSSGFAEYSTVIAGVITFGVAAFMPFLVIRLLPVVEAAAVAQGIHSAPIRAAQTAMQYAYYVQGVHGRVAGTGPGVGGSELTAHADQVAHRVDPATRPIGAE